MAVQMTRDTVLNESELYVMRLRVTQDARVVFVSTAFAKVLGYDTPDEMSDALAQDLYRHVHPDDYAYAVAAASEHVRSKTAFEMRLRLVRLSGDVIYVICNANVAEVSPGDVELTAVFSDVSSLVYGFDQPELLPLDANFGNDAMLSNWGLPYGIIEVSVGRAAHVRFANRMMLELLHAPVPEDDGPLQAINYVRTIEAWPFAKLVSVTEADGQPIGKVTSFIGAAKRLDGTVVELSGWIRKTSESDGEAVYRFSCSEIFQAIREKRSRDFERFASRAHIRGLVSVFGIDLSANSIRCLRTPLPAVRAEFGNMHMALDRLVARWRENIAPEEGAEELFECLTADYYISHAAEYPETIDFTIEKPERVRMRAIIAAVGPGRISVTFCRRGATEEPSDDGVAEDLSDTALLRDYMERPVYIRTFGHFDVFIKGRSVPFRHAKSKELLALLIDRRGGFVSSRDAISHLWEDEVIDKVTMARYRKVAMRLKQTLEEYGIGHIVEKVDGARRINLDAVTCDLYEYMWNGRKSLFKGVYMADYSWGESLLAELQFDAY